LAKKLTYEIVKKVIEEDYLLELISDKYQNLQKPLIVNCSTCGEMEVSLADIRKHKGCPECNPIFKRRSSSSFTELPKYNTPLELWRISKRLFPAELASLIDYDLSTRDYLLIESGQVQPTEEQVKRIRIFTGITIVGGLI